MYSVFLVEDEIAIREGLRTGFPWEQYGFAFAGGAEDGEVALPHILQVRPDLVITDIRMPFMDGIELSRMVKKELPDTRIIIISGFDDFSYAQQAISIGVDKYILKPVTRDKLAQVLSEVGSKLEEEQEKHDYIQQFRMENQEYEQFSRNRFFNELVAGAMSVSEVYERAKALSLELDADVYNLILLNVVNRAASPSPATYSNAMAELSDRLTRYFLVCPEYILFHWNLDSYAVVVKGDEVSVRSRTRTCIENISRRCSDFEKEVDWYLAEGRTVSRFGEFSASFDAANKKLTCRYMKPGKHIFTEEDVRGMSKSPEAPSAVIDQKLVGKFLETGVAEEIGGFLDNLVPGDTSATLASLLFDKYFTMTMYVCTCDYIKTIGGDPGELLPGDIRQQLEEVSGCDTLGLVETMFRAAMSYRDGQSKKHYKSQFEAAREYVDSHFSDVGLCLNDVAREINISPGYLSALFSREADATFVEYMTAKRMEEAARLLRTSDMRSSQIAETVGYKDSHYFGFLFKKTYGMTPREYRAQNSN